MELSVEQLMDQARQLTGLADFGEDSYRPGLERLVDAINRESSPTEIGKIAIPGSILELLVNRLQVEDWYRRHPEIDDEVIRDPVFITGLPRTGSTALGHMLGLDSETRSLRGWETYAPCPPPDIEVSDDPRVAANEKRMADMDALAPGIGDAMPRNPNAPEECFPILNLTFACVAVNGFYHVPSFERWVMMDGLAEIDAAYRYHRRVLKLLQWKTPAKRWVLRSPVHSLAMDALLKVYPEARFVITHRRPEGVLPSISFLIHQVRDVFLTNPSPKTLGPMQLDQWSEAARRMLRTRDRLGEARFFDIYHSEQIVDPEPGLEKLYAWLGWDYRDDFVARLRDWRQENPKGKHPADLDFFGLDRDEIVRRFGFYTERFGARM
ncbi:MAG: sulfotransferase [Porticoccaceae bacterium]|jgi:hypothetical protein|nr:sulfotransferase [Porticoccaceae bacterium]